MNRRTRLVSSLLLLAVLVGVPVVLTWRAVKQERLNRALIVAVKQRKADVVVSLLKQGADPNAKEHSEQPVTVWQVFRHLFLHLRQGKLPPQQEGNPALISALTTTEQGADEERVRVEPHTVVALLNAGADPNCRENNDPHRTSLCYAIIYCPSLVAPLLEKGADVNARNDYEDTPLMYAHDPANVRLLLDRGADVNAHNRDDTSVLAYYISFVGSSPEIIRLLKQAGAKE